MLDGFIKKWNRRYLDYDGKPLYQCVDLIKAYFAEVLSLPVKSYGNAKDYWYNHPKELSRITNNPQKGDIVIFDMGRYGHIGIVVDQNNSGLIVFQQNDPLRTPCSLKVYSYRNIIGYLRPTNILNMNYEQLLQKLITDLKKEFVEKDGRFNFDPTNGATEICNNFKKYKYGTKPDDHKILANKFCKENISEAEKGYVRTTNRKEVL